MIDRKIKGKNLRLRLFLFEIFRRPLLPWHLAYVTRRRHCCVMRRWRLRNACSVTIYYFPAFVSRSFPTHFEFKRNISEAKTQPAAFYHPPSSSQREEAIGTPTSSTRSSPHEWIDGQAAGSNGVRAASQSITSATRSCFFLDRGVHNALVFSASVGRESVRFGRQVEL